jgi:ATP-dependent Clp protease adaptor protein ClpS
MVTETPVIEKKKQAVRSIKEPKKFKVVVCNDDVTTMEFVILMLVEVFNHSSEKAIDLTIDIHNNGKAVAGTYTYEIAEQKAFEAVELARLNDFPLVVKVETE